ncbi:nuclear transport factor 2 family protein [Ectopseudomonas mendocina]|uniref:Nuclear transport factor 2 family protein n=1 Tax=Ectopseudomonas mendocina TaxID=300 RepID=A0ABD7RPR6_ECTME|nr:MULTISPECIES: nuclear transport factor 2 family protein [Pseudomonas]TRO13212.1 nuclear transport factor 2 family protein [Pseudomonas mendocina]TRO15343.1 nuclear transport factor 2 family protein [Pseudomonas mendocina]TRO34019.1 nuclear transport factor 2 family protein [Pseudomonas sp. ALS1131]
MSDFLREFAEHFAALNKDNLDRLGELYSDDVLFRDPLHEVHGLNEMRRYFAELYANVEALRFEFHGFDQVADGEGYLRWTMYYRHPRLRGGAEITVEGCSHLLWRERVYRHRDYFDAGALLYEHLPVLGSVIAWLKRRLA